MSRAIEERYVIDHGSVPMTGVQALARLPMNVRRADLAAGRETGVFVSGYEGSPLAGYDLELHRNAELLNELDIVFQPGVNEELAATAVQGTQLVSGSPEARVEGVTGIWYGKSPGLDRAADALRHANLIGTHPVGGAIALVGDDPAAKSSTVPGASEYLLADLGMPILYPADPQEALDLGMHAVALSRYSGLWVGLKIVTNVADGTAHVQTAADRIQPVLPKQSDARHQPHARLAQPALAELERSRERTRMSAALAYARANHLNRLEQVGTRSTVGIIAAGKTGLDVRQALTMLGMDGDDRVGVRLLRLAMIHPLVPEEIIDFADGLDEIVVVEEKRPFVESAVKQILYGLTGAPAIAGRTNRDIEALFASEGELDADLIATGLAGHLSKRPEFSELRTWQKARSGMGSVALLPVVPRTPYFCSGCPHNSSTKVPSGSAVGAGIGCHALVLLMEPQTVGDVVGLTQMGGEGAQWIGMAPFRRATTHLLQNMGDGTFHHSGSLAIRAAVASGVDITFKLLHNSAVAMTGGQRPAGAMTISALTAALTAEGVRRIIITTEDPRRYRGMRLPKGIDVWPRSRLLEAQEVLREIPGVTVLVHDQECATELRRKRKRGLAVEPAERVMINQRMCEGCGDCGRKSNCLSVQPLDTEFGRKTAIDHSSCNSDYACLTGDCPSFITVIPKNPPATPTSRGTSLTVDELPDPPANRPVATHTTRIAGIGGTGVMTVSQVLNAAAHFAGREARTLDQTGLAQKGGAVVSDLKISAEPFAASNKATIGDCDLYIGCDLLVAAQSTNLAVADPARTVAVVSTTQVATGAMVTDSSMHFPELEALTQRIRSRTREDAAVFVDARRMSTALFGSDHFANVFLAGVACQLGALPLPAWAIEKAIDYNGIQVETNIQAFRRGRQYVADPAAFTAATNLRDGGERKPSVDDADRDISAMIGAEPGSDLDRIITRCVHELLGYQGRRCAKRYADVVAAVREAEEHCGSGSELTVAVATYLYKLMAYKDEYEVARLALHPDSAAEIRAEFGSNAKVYYHLHPPLLRSLGLDRKIKVGPWFKVVFRALRALRAVRGTPFDPFGHTRLRRLERALIAEYVTTVRSLLPILSADNLEQCVELAKLPDLVRGYEQVKLAAVEQYRARLLTLVRELQGTEA